MNGIRGQPGRLSNINQHARISDVPKVHEVGAVKCTMNTLAGLRRIRPLRKFLSQPAVIRVRPAAVGQALGFHQSFHPIVHCIEIHTAAGKEFFERTALGRSFRMKWKINPLNLYIEVLSQLFNTPGTEIAPRSNEVGEDLQQNGFGCHVSSIAQDWKFSAKHCAASRYLKPFIRG